jgi:hypothetical protein
MRQRLAKPYAQYRRAAGQAIAEGVVMLVLMTFVAIGLTFLILNSGVSMMHQQKITFIASQAASFFIYQGTGWEYQNSPSTPDVNTFAKNLGQAMGYNRNSITATANQTGAIVNVTVIGTSLPLIRGSFLPNFITVRDTFSADTSMFPRPTGCVSVTATDGSYPRIIIPCYGNSPSHIPGPGMYDQWSIFAPPGTFTPGSRGTTP